jgi:tetratricopeptide (TPR) repeat protein
MTTEILYERYKDALRRGHVNALRGHPQAALEAYGEAADLAPDRPLAHVSRAGVLLRLGRTDEALTGYEVALRLAPRDAAALGGRADALAKLGRRSDAAEAFDVLAELHEAAGRTAEACDTARRALEQAESKSRRRHVEELTTTLRGAVGDKVAEQALSRALHVLEGTAPALARPIAPSTADVTAVDAPPERPPVELESPFAEEEPEPPADALALAVEAEAALDAGDADTAREKLLAAAIAHQAAGRFAAALDACYGALAVAPSDTDLHLELVDLYLARGWRAPAAEKLILLSRLIDLDGDGPARERLCSMVAARFPDDPRLAAICA